MKRLIKMEIKKAIVNKFFIITVIFGIVLCMLSAFLMISSFFEQGNRLRMIQERSGYLINPNIPSNTLFNHWIGGEYVTLMQSLFFLLIPLFSTIPYGWSYLTEKKSGYIKHVLIHTNKKSAYFFAKYIAVFLSGGLAVLIPLVLNLAVVAMYVPAITPDVSYDLYLAVFLGDLWSELFYTMPFLFVGLYLILIFLFSGCIANIGFLLAFIVKNRFIAVFSPFFIFLFLHYASDMFGYILHAEISPLYFLHPSTIRNMTKGSIVAIEAAVLFFVPFTLCLIQGRKQDVF